MHPSALLDVEVRGPDAFGEASEPEGPRLVLADEVNRGPRGDLVLHAYCPVASVDQQSAEALAYQILRRPHGRGEDTAGLPSLCRERPDPGDRHHWVVLLARS